MPFSLFKKNKSAKVPTVQEKEIVTDLNAFARSFVDSEEAKSVEHITVGTSYGGWKIPELAMSRSQTVFACGAGEDISFDLTLAEKFGQRVFIIDPTPRAEIHYQKVEKAVASGDSTAAVNGDEMKLHYQISPEAFERVSFHKVGVWDQDETVKFYVPKDKRHVSHSILNLQKTEEYFEAPVRKLSSLMTEIGCESLDVLKIDIEGAEYKVLQDLCASDLRPLTLCVEFDELHNKLDEDWPDRIRSTIEAINKAGYVCTFSDRSGSTFLNRALLS